MEHAQLFLHAILHCELQLAIGFWELLSIPKRQKNTVNLPISLSSVRQSNRSTAFLHANKTNITIIVVFYGVYFVNFSIKFVSAVLFVNLFDGYKEQIFTNNWIFF